MGSGKTHFDGFMRAKGGKMEWDQEPLTEIDGVQDSLPSRSLLTSLREYLSPARVITMIKILRGSEQS